MYAKRHEFVSQQLVMKERRKKSVQYQGSVKI
uniref:Uncharacterized protein n=1 Tax=Anguilla anguilla TaxID=7936 RepID=A0A0E9S938_ANGAN